MRKLSGQIGIIVTCCLSILVASAIPSCFGANIVSTLASNDYNLNDAVIVPRNVIIVDDDGLGDYTTIQEALDNAFDGDEIRVWDGVYVENITINATVSVVGNSSATTFIQGTGINNTVVTLLKDDIRFSGFTITDAETAGIIVNNNQGAIIQNVVVTNATYGIYMITSRNIVIQNSTITNNTYGSSLSFSFRITLQDNNISDNENEGLLLTYVFLSTITRNNFINNAVTVFRDHATFTNSFFNSWTGNYWDNHNSTERKRIHGQILLPLGVSGVSIPWINYDQLPAQTPFP